MNTKRIKAMLKYLPCRASAIPANLRSLRDAEQEGLAVYGERGCWRLTPKGKALLSEVAR